MSMQDVFNISVVIFTVSNLAAMGLEMNLREALKFLRSVRAIGLILLWGWVVGPALAWLIIRLLPLNEAHAAGLLLISLAPTAPFFPLMVSKARGDMSFAAAFMMLTTIGVVLFLPLLAPRLIEGLTVDAWALAKPLLMMVLLPLLIGGAIRVFAPNAADKLFPVVKKIGGIFLLISPGAHPGALRARHARCCGQLRPRSPGPVLRRDHGALVLHPFRPGTAAAQRHGAWDVHAQYRRGVCSIFRHHESAAGPVRDGCTRGPAGGDRRGCGGTPVRPTGPERGSRYRTICTTEREKGVSMKSPI